MNEEHENRMALELEGGASFFSGDLRTLAGLDAQGLTWLKENGRLIETELSVPAASAEDGVNALIEIGLLRTAEDVLESWSAADSEEPRWHFRVATDIRTATPRGAIEWCGSSAASYVSAAEVEEGETMRLSVSAGEGYDGYQVLVELLLRFMAVAAEAGLEGRGFVLGAGHEGGFTGVRLTAGAIESWFQEELQDLEPEDARPFVPEGALPFPD